MNKVQKFKSEKLFDIFGKFANELQIENPLSCGQLTYDINVQNTQLEIKITLDIDGTPKIIKWNTIDLSTLKSKKLFYSQEKTAYHLDRTSVYKTDKFIEFIAIFDFFCKK